jgi:hypothetical protein
MRRSNAIRLTVLPMIAASAVALGQDRVCVDGSSSEGCLEADTNISNGNGEPASPFGSGVSYGGFGGWYTTGHVVHG